MLLFRNQAKLSIVMQHIIDYENKLSTQNTHISLFCLTPYQNNIAQPVTQTWTYNLSCPGCRHEVHRFCSNVGPDSGDPFSWTGSNIGQQYRCKSGPQLTGYRPHAVGGAGTPLCIAVNINSYHTSGYTCKTPLCKH